MNTLTALAREAAGRSIVLLKNEAGILPLSPSQKVAVIGEFAEKPRYQGGGSSHINPTRVDTALEKIREVEDVIYMPGEDTRVATSKDAPKRNKRG